MTVETDDDLVGTRIPVCGGTPTFSSGAVLLAWAGTIYFVFFRTGWDYYSLFVGIPPLRFVFFFDLLGGCSAMQLRCW